MSIKTEICQAYLRTSDHLIGFTLILIVIWLKQPSSNIPFLRAELHSYFHDFTSVCLIRNQIAFFINLLQSLLGSPIQFEFEYIYIYLGVFNTASVPSNLTINFLKRYPAPFSPNSFISIPDSTRNYHIYFSTMRQLKQPFEPSAI